MSSKFEARREKAELIGSSLFSEFLAAIGTKTVFAVCATKHPSTDTASIGTGN